jgi:hypothetical protein
MDLFYIKFTILKLGLYYHKNSIHHHSKKPYLITVISN